MRTFIRFNITHVHLRLSSTQRFTDIDVNNGDPGDQKNHASNGVEDLIHGGTVTAVTKHELEHMPYAD